MKLATSLAFQAFFAVAGSTSVLATSSDSFKRPRSILSVTQIRGGGGADPSSSLGFPDAPAWGWNKAPAKTSLSNPEALGPYLPSDQSWSAKGWELNLVQLVHWTPVVPSVIMAWQVFKNANAWESYLGTKQRVLMMLLSPIVAFFGGLPGIMMHTYEGWMVAPFKNPLANDTLDVKAYNNEWLRIVAYHFIFVMQYVGLQLLSVAILGPEYFWGTLGSLSVAGFLIAYLGNQKPKATFDLFGHSTFPLSWYTIVPFIMCAVLNMFAFFKLGEHVYANEGFVGAVKSLAAPVLIAAGGVIEGLLAETRFNQWLHIFAVILFNAGFWCQLDMFKLVV
mmetsp:Transcript_6997/g.9460  ORF Transcript_6997/g.9460 Transcript_6997/m.9460 type:complete len:336 (-) Transcript_6997:156-1163(-)